MITFCHSPVANVEATEQPLPMPGQRDVNDRVREMLPTLLASRQMKGRQTYGRPLETWNGRDASRELLDELIDAVQYAVQCQMEREDLERRVEALSLAPASDDLGLPVSYLCACCGAPSYPPELSSLDTGTTLTCSECAGKTVVMLTSTDHYRETAVSEVTLAAVIGVARAAYVLRRAAGAGIVDALLHLDKAIDNLSREGIVLLASDKAGE